MTPITLDQLTALANYINKITGTNSYFISRSYGGYSLHQSHLSGGESDALRSGHITKRELYNRLHAFIAGYELATSKD